jgi:hypothetical protein
MKTLIYYAQIILMIGLAGGSAVQAQNTLPGAVDFGKLTPSADGGEFVEVNIRSNLILMAARLAEKAEPQVAELLRGIQQVRVNVLGLSDANRADIRKRVQTIREQLDSLQWERVVTVQKSQEDVGVYLKMRGDEAVEGLVVTVLSGDKEAVLVNIVGNIRPEKVAMIGERFNIEPLKNLGPALEKKP